MVLSFCPRRVAGALVLAVLLLFLLHAALMVLKFVFGHPHVFGLVRLFDFNGEQNVPALFSSVMLLFCAGLLGVVAAVQIRLGKHYGEWLGMALLFVFLGVDESTSIHERLSEPIRNALDTGGVLYFAWVIPYGILAALVLLLSFRLLADLAPRLRLLVMLSGAIYVGGAVGLELAGSSYWQATEGQLDATYALITTFEETLEMAGLVLFAYALMTHLATALAPVMLTLADRTATATLPADQRLDRSGPAERSPVRQRDR